MKYPQDPSLWKMEKRHINKNQKITLPSLALCLMISLALIGQTRNINKTLRLSSVTKHAVIGRDRNVNKGLRLSSAAKSALIGRGRNVNKVEDSCRASLSVSHYQANNKQRRKHQKTIKVFSSDLDENQYKYNSPQRTNPIKKDKVRSQKHPRMVLGQKS